MFSLPKHLLPCVDQKDDPSVEDADEEGKWGYHERGKGNDKPPTNPRGELSPMNPKAYIGIPIPM